MKSPVVIIVRSLKNFKITGDDAIISIIENAGSFNDIVKDVWYTSESVLVLLEHEFTVDGEI